MSIHLVSAVDSAQPLSKLFSFLFSGSNWSGTYGFPNRILQHLGYTGEIMLVAVVIALPLGLWAGHTGKGAAFLSLLANISQAIPTLGLLTLLAVAWGVGFIQAAAIPLLVLAIPSILANTFVGIHGVDPALVDAAKGMGLTPRQVLFQVEIPVALPLIILGLRTAALQVVATVTIAAYIGDGGLGRFIFDGLANRNFAEMGAGALVLAILAILIEGLFLLAQRRIVSPGVRGRAD